MFTFLREVAFFLEELAAILLRLAPLIFAVIALIVLVNYALDFLLKGGKVGNASVKIVISEDLLAIIIDLVAIWNNNLVYFSPDQLPSGYNAVSLEGFGVKDPDQLFLNSDNLLLVAIKNVLLEQPNQPDFTGLGFVSDVIGDLWRTTSSEQRCLYANFIGGTRDHFKSLSLPISEGDLGCAQTALARRQALDMLDA